MPAALSAYTTSRSINGSDVAGFIDPAAVHRFVAGGASLDLNDLQNVHDGVSALCDVLTGRIGWPFSAMAFLSPPSQSAFVLHRDPLHVVVLQTSGTKTWELHRPVAGPDHGPVPADSLGAADRHVTLEAGDALYVPPG